jgi:hypothetical protein
VIENPKKILLFFLSIVTSIFSACDNPDNQNLFINLYPITIDDADPLAEINQMNTTVVDGHSSYTVSDFDFQKEIGLLDLDNPFRLELIGIGADNQILSWGFSPTLNLGNQNQKTTIFFSRHDVAVAYAGPSLIDPQEGLAVTNVPVGIKGENFDVTMVYNNNYFYLDIHIRDDELIDNSPDSYAGDLVIIAVDGQDDNSSPFTTYDSNDFVAIFGSKQTTEIWNPNGLAYPVIRSFRKDNRGYNMFVAIPVRSLDSLQDNNDQKEGRLGLGVAVIDVDSSGVPVITNWPDDWKPTSAEDPSSYYPVGLGVIEKKNRVLDARQVSRNTVDFDQDISEFIRAGSIPLSYTQSAGEDEIELFALWDSDGIKIAVSSNDGVFCGFDRNDGDRQQIIKDDAIEISISHQDGAICRALQNISGSTSYDRSDQDPWQPEIYFRFDFDGPPPDNDCQIGDGYTYQASILWKDLGFTAQPPNLNDTFSFDIAVYDNDRGARTAKTFSPLNPTEDQKNLAELRLFKY